MEVGRLGMSELAGGWRLAGFVSAGVGSLRRRKTQCRQVTTCKARRLLEARSSVNALGSINAGVGGVP